MSNTFNMKSSSEVLVSNKNLPITLTIYPYLLSFSKQINGMLKSCYYQIHDFAHIRCFLPKSVAITVANALVSSHLNYCKSLLKGYYDYDLRRLKDIKNVLFRSHTRFKVFTHNSPPYRIALALCVSLLTSSGVPSFQMSPNWSSALFSLRSNSHLLYCKHKT